jgi:hypothetical protein
LSLLLLLGVFVREYSYLHTNFFPQDERVPTNCVCFLDTELHCIDRTYVHYRTLGLYTVCSFILSRIRGFGSRKLILTAVGIRCADHATPLSAKVGTNFVDKRRSLGRRSSLAG